MKKRFSMLLVYILICASILLLALSGSKAITVISEIQPLTRDHCVIIDAGHGGVDGGAVSCTGIPESAYNLEIAWILNDLFCFLGYDTRMIRTADISIYTTGDTIAQKKLSDLKERVRIVNETKNGLLLSLHQNTFPDSRYSGAQVFYANTEGSRELGQTLQSSFSSILNPGSRRQCKLCSGIYLMEHVTKPAVLIECGFLSNPEEESLLRSNAYRQKLCGIIASCTDTFLSNT